MVISKQQEWRAGFREKWRLVGFWLTVYGYAVPEVDVLSKHITDDEITRWRMLFRTMVRGS